LKRPTKTTLQDVLPVASTLLAALSFMMADVVIEMTFVGVVVTRLLI
jgi:hypothetical protein